MINVYLICAEFEGRRLYKIGYTRRDVSKRIKELKTGNGSEMYVIDSFKSKWGTKIEAVLKKRYSHCNISGEWFNLSESEISEFNIICHTLHKNIETLSINNTFIIDNGWK
jgi:hypothetical protein